ncbi:MAG: lipid-binding protein [Flavobacteriaceae bacterium]|nr:lipid-binding protein [Flavobacteriaceae bacterium]
MFKNKKNRPCQHLQTLNSNGNYDESHSICSLRFKSKILTFLTLLICSIGVGQKLNLDISSSKLKWTGKEITTKEHYGSLDFKSGFLNLDNKGVTISGIFVVDMTTLKNEDVPEAYRGRLEGHLKSDDFFSTDKFPEATLELTNSSSINENEYKAEALLTIKEITHPVTFNLINNDNQWKANLIFDRSKYDVRFRSGTFFENLGDKLILDDIIIETDLIFN